MAAAHIEQTRREDLTGDARIDLLLLGKLEAEPEVLRTILAKSLEASAKHWSPSEQSRWGDIHTARFTHPIRSEAEWSLPPIPKSGSPDTVNVSARDKDNVQTVGASLRVICDVGEWDNSIAVNTPGQSGDPRSQHYSNLTALWASGQYFQLAYSPETVARLADMRYAIEPSVQNRNLA
jgi:penicillin G amidase